MDAHDVYMVLVAAVDSIERAQGAPETRLRGILYAIAVDIAPQFAGNITRRAVQAEDDDPAGDHVQGDVYAGGLQSWARAPAEQEPRNTIGAAEAERLDGALMERSVVMADGSRRTTWYVSHRTTDHAVPPSPATPPTSTETDSGSNDLRAILNDLYSGGPGESRLDFVPQGTVTGRITSSAPNKISPSNDDYDAWVSSQLQLCGFDHDTQLSLMLTLLHEELVGYYGSKRYPAPVWEVEWRGTRLVYRLVVAHPHETIIYVGSSRGRSLAAAIVAIAKDMAESLDAQVMAKVREVRTFLHRGHWKAEPLPESEAPSPARKPNKWDF